MQVMRQSIGRKKVANADAGGICANAFMPVQRVSLARGVLALSVPPVRLRPVKPKESCLFPLFQVGDVTHLIQLAVAPVFLLTAVGTIINVLTNRLARIVDRIRTLEERLEQDVPKGAEAMRDELRVLDRRMRLVYQAVTAQVCCGLMVGLIIAVAFVDAFLSVKLAGLVAMLFMLGMVAFISSLIIFLREIFLAVSTTHASLR